MSTIYTLPLGPGSNGWSWRVAGFFPCSSHQETIGPVKRKPCCAITAKVANKTLFLMKLQKWNRPRDCRCSCKQQQCWFKCPSVWPSPSKSCKFVIPYFLFNNNLVVTITGRGPHPKYPYMRRMGLESLPMTTRTLILGKYSQFMERLVLLVEVGLKCGEGLTCTCSNNFGGSMN